MKVYIWGTGAMTSDYMKQKEIEPDEILGFIESKRTKDTFEGKQVYEPREISDDYDYILVCVRYAGREIYQLCKNVGINVNKLVLMDNWEWLNGKPIDTIPPKCCHKIVDNGIDVQKLFPKLYDIYMKEQEIQANRYVTISRNGYDLCDENILILSEEFNSLLYQTDYFRYRTFELVANEIIRKKIEGNVAEVGVYRGTFSKLINMKFKDKKLYLFDTFESFDLNEFHYELEEGRVPEEFLEICKKTSVKMVLDIMPYPDMCIIRKGFFPETASGLEHEKYAFVSIDVDFEKSILASLRYFYPRLNQGGAIFVHDYNNRFLEGVKKAVDTYEDEIGCQMHKIPLADEGGTLVLAK